MTSNAHEHKQLGISMSSANGNSHTPDALYIAYPQTDDEVTDRFGVSLTVRFQSAPIIVDVKGEIDAGNAERVSTYVGNLLSLRRNFALNLSGVDFLGVEGFRALVGINRDCQQAGLRWAMITSHAVHRLLRIADGNHQLPTAASVADAVQQLIPPDQVPFLRHPVTPLELTLC
jgi:anti-anti-sigma factor